MDFASFFSSFFSEAPYPAFLTAAIMSSVLTSLLAVTTALSGMLTTALETPSTPVSAACTFLTHPTPQVMPLIFRLTVLVSSFSALISAAAALFGVVSPPAVAMPMEKAASEQVATMVGSVFMVCVFFVCCLQDAFPMIIKRPSVGAVHHTIYSIEKQNCCGAIRPKSQPGNLSFFEPRMDTNEREGSGFIAVSMAVCE